MESTARTKFLAGAALTCVSSTVGILYKVSQAATGGFAYSTTSAIAIAESIKLVMSLAGHIAEHRSESGTVAGVRAAIASAKSQLSLCAVLHIWLLSFMYTLNNQLSFLVYTMADPGTIFLAKSASTIIVALMQILFVGKSFTADQWKAMVLQMVGMIIVQYNPCNQSLRYSNEAYALMALSTFISSVTAVRNEYTIKNFKMSFNMQNAVLYVGGVIFNTAAFVVLARYTSGKQATIGFFDGYSNPLALGVVFANAVVGLAITAVYKYADAVIKCISTDCTATLLCIVSSIFFGLRSSITMWCGVIVVLFAVHSYTEAVARATAGVVPPAKPCVEVSDHEETDHLVKTTGEGSDDIDSDEKDMENRKDEAEMSATTRKAEVEMSAVIGKCSQDVAVATPSKAA